MEQATSASLPVDSAVHSVVDSSIDPAIDSTPEFAAALYARMRRTLSDARRVFSQPLTLAEKVLLSHLYDPCVAPAIRGETYVQLRPDRVILQDVLGQTAFLQFMQTGRSRVAVPTTVHCDHLIQARSHGSTDLAESLRENQEVYDFLRSACAKYGAGFWAPGAGIIHQVTLERYAFPGQLIVGTDSHTPNGGGLGACAVGVGGADAVEVMAGLPWEVLYPKVIGVRLTGQLGGWTSPKDVILRLAGLLTVSGATNAIVEYFGPGAQTISATGKATICNMGAELGATTSLFPHASRISAYLAATNRAPLATLADENVDPLTADPEVERLPHTFYDKVIEIDLSTLEPHVVGPHSPDRARPLSQLADEVGAPGSQLTDAISAALVGSRTNSSYEDMSRAAHVAAQARAHSLRATVPLMVTPGSEQIRATIARDGQLHALESLGATVLANACGPCIGQWRRDDADATGPNTIVTSYNRNFPMRNDGRATTMNLIASPEIVTAFALAGRLSFNPLTDPLTAASSSHPRPRPKSRPPASRAARPITPRRRRTAPPSRSQSAPPASACSPSLPGPRGTARTFSTCPSS